MFGTPQVIRPSASVNVGVVGPKGASLLGGPRAPLATDGFDNDFWLVLLAGSVQLYGPKTSGVWPSNYLSLTGPQGAPGPQILSGIGAPTQTIGNGGDFYIDLGASALYGPKNSGQWPTPGISLVGQTGATGPANTLTAGTATQLPAGAQPTITITGQAPNQTVSLGIPQGQPGKNGTGTGTVVGPASSTAGNIAVYADGTGTNILDGGRPGFVVVDTPLSPYTSVNRDEVWWNTVSAAAVQLLPANPTASMRVRAIRSGGNTVTVQQNGNTIAKVAADLVLDVDMMGAEFIWDATLSTWLVVHIRHA